MYIYFVNKYTHIISLYSIHIFTIGMTSSKKTKSLIL